METINSVDLKEQKKALRHQIIRSRSAMSKGERRRSSALISDHILMSQRFLDASVIAGYMTFGSEFETRELLKQARQVGKTVVLPTLAEKSGPMLFRTWSRLEEDLQDGPFGIKQPDPSFSEVVDVGSLDFIIVPGVAFTVLGDRLGYGGGYYDRAIGRASKIAYKIAPAFTCQIVRKIPLEDHDFRVDEVVTENIGNG